MLVEGAVRFSSPLSALLLFNVYGATTRVPGDAIAFGARRAQWDFDVIGVWENAAESPTHIAWVRELRGRLEPHLKGSV